MLHFGYKIKPIKFHPSPSSVENRIFEINSFCDGMDGSDCDFNQLRDILIETFKNAGIKAWMDNKTVFECELDGNTIYYGFYDWIFSIGFGVYTQK